MIYLALTLIGSCFISYGFKLASIKKTDQDYIVFLNYFTAFLGMAIYCAASGNIEVSGLKNGPMLMLAIFLMLFMFGNLVGNNASTDRNGINNTTFFNRIGFLPCILLSAIIWMDILGIWQIIGMVILVGSLMLMMKDLKQIKRENLWMLFGLTFTNGMVSFLNIVYGRYFSSKTEILFLATVFLMAALLAAVILVKKGKMPWKCKKDDFLIGVFIGLSNILTTLFMLKSYTAVTANIVAPTTAAGNMIFAAVVGKLAFKEKISRSTVAALILAIVSVVLVNV